MTGQSDTELDAIIATLSDEAQRTIKGAIGDPIIGLWIGKSDSVWEIHERSLTARAPADGGGTWGEVAPLNDTGIAVMSRMLKLQTH